MKKAFTLSEVLVTMTIVGVIAAMTIPALVQRYRTVEYTSRAKKTYSEVSNAMAEILRQEEAKTLTEVGFASNKDKLISNVLKILSTSDSFGYPILKLDGSDYTMSIDKTYLLPDGAMFGIANKGTNTPGYKLVIDVNGKKEPNIIGRDVFFYWIKENGSVVPNGTDTDTSGALKGSNCSADGNGFSCANKLIEDGWEMNY